VSEFLFMGEQDDPELEVWLGRGLRVYDGTRPISPLTPDVRAPAMRPPNPRIGFHVWQSGGWVKCGCGQCFYGPCPRPMHKTGG